MMQSPGPAGPVSPTTFGRPQEQQAPPQRASLAALTALVTAVAAGIAVLVAGLVAYPLVRNAAADQARASLARQADLVTDAFQEVLTDSQRFPMEPSNNNRLSRLAAALEVEQVFAYFVEGDTSAIEGLAPTTTAEVVSALSSGRSYSAEVDGDNGSLFLEGRPAAPGLGILLVQPVDVAQVSGTDAFRRTGWALVIGLVLAVAVGALASRRVTRSLREAAHAAERLSTGDRDVRLDPDGPAEVAEIAEALNRLAGALTASEQRQRDFLLSVSHELRTPLTAVRGYAEALADGIVPADDVSRTGGIVLAEAERLDRLVADLLDLARLGSVDFRLDLAEVDLDAFSMVAAEVWTDRASRVGVPFRLERAGFPVTVRTDPVRIRQIVDNLAENALRMTPAGSPVVLAVRVEAGDAVVEVRDGGPGLSEDDLRVAFEPAALFLRYRGVRQVGSGVGLALVGQLAGRLGGVAEAGSSSEGGARFAVRLPLIDNPPTSAIPAVAEHVPASSAPPS